MVVVDARTTSATVADDLIVPGTDTVAHAHRPVQRDEP